MDPTRLRLALRLTVLVVFLGSLAAAPPQAASAAPTEEVCPGSSINPAISAWQQAYRARGITLCKGLNGSGSVVAWVQIVDFEDGAKMRLVTELPTNSGDPSAQFPKKTIPQWWSWTLANYATPDPGLLFSATNATFVRDTGYASTTALSYPLKKWQTVLTPGEADDPVEKRIFGFGDPRGNTQSVHVVDWGDRDNDIDLALAQQRLAPYFDAAVSLHPDHPIGGNEYRTYVGTRSTDGLWTGSQDRAYILVTQIGMTNAAAKQILVTDYRTQWNIQMDGGGSSGIRTRDFGQWCAWSGLPGQSCRYLPNALAVYISPWE